MGEWFGARLGDLLQGTFTNSMLDWDVQGGQLSLPSRWMPTRRFVCGEFYSVGRSGCGGVCGFPGFNTHSRGRLLRNVAGCGMSQCHAVHRDLLCWWVLHGFGGERVTCEGLSGDVMCGGRHSVCSRGMRGCGGWGFFEGFRCFRERAADVMMRFAMGSESRVTEYKTLDAGVCGELLRWMFADPRFFNALYQD